jgi:hypothetical protein
VPAISIRNMHAPSTCPAANDVNRTAVLDVAEEGRRISCSKSKPMIVFQEAIISSSEKSLSSVPAVLRAVGVALATVRRLRAGECK